MEFLEYHQLTSSLSVYLPETRLDQASSDHCYPGREKLSRLVGLSESSQQAPSDKPCSLLAELVRAQIQGRSGPSGEAHQPANLEEPPKRTHQVEVASRTGKGAGAGKFGFGVAVAGESAAEIACHSSHAVAAAIHPNPANPKCDQQDSPRPTAASSAHVPNPEAKATAAPPAQARKPPAAAAGYGSSSDDSFDTYGTPPRSRMVPARAAPAHGGQTAAAPSAAAQPRAGLSAASAVRLRGDESEMGASPASPEEGCRGGGAGHGGAAADSPDSDGVRRAMLLRGALSAEKCDPHSPVLSPPPPPTRRRPLPPAAAATAPLTQNLKPDPSRLRFAAVSTAHPPPFPRPLLLPPCRQLYAPPRLQTRSGLARPARGAHPPPPPLDTARAGAPPRFRAR